MKKTNNTIYLVCATVLIEVLGFSMVIPILPLMFTEPSSDLYVLGANASQQLQYVLLGLLFAMYMIGQFFANPILGQLSDKYGRRLILGLAVLGTGLSNFVFAFGAMIASLWILFGARLIDGITGGSIAIAEAVAADISEPGNRSKYFGLVGASLGLGFMFGPLMGGVLSDPTILPFFGAPFTFFVSGLLSIGNVFFIYKYLPETSPMDTSIAIRPARSVRNIGRAFKNKTTRGIYSLSFLYSFGFTLFTSFFGVYLVSQLDYSQSQIGYFFFYLGVLVIPYQSLVVPYVDKTLKKVTQLYIAFVGLAISLVVIALTTQTWELLLIVIVFSGANAIGRTAVTSVVSQKAAQNEQGQALGINSSVQALGQALPALFAGLMAASLGVTAPLYFGAMVFMLGVLVVFLNRHKFN